MTMILTQTVACLLLLVLPTGHFLASAHSSSSKNGGRPQVQSGQQAAPANFIWQQQQQQQQQPANRQQQQLLQQQQEQLDDQLADFMGQPVDGQLLEEQQMQAQRQQANTNNQLADTVSDSSSSSILPGERSNTGQLLSSSSPAPPSSLSMSLDGMLMNSRPRSEQQINGPQESGASASRRVPLVGAPFSSPATKGHRSKPKASNNQYMGQSFSLTGSMFGGSGSSSLSSEGELETPRQLSRPANADTADVNSNQFDQRITNNFDMGGEQNSAMFSQQKQQNLDELTTFELMSNLLAASQAAQASPGSQSNQGQQMQQQTNPFQASPPPEAGNQMVMSMITSADGQRNQLVMMPRNALETLQRLVSEQQLQRKQQQQSKQGLSWWPVTSTPSSRPASGQQQLLEAVNQSPIATTTTTTTTTTSTSTTTPAPQHTTLLDTTTTSATITTASPTQMQTVNQIVVDQGANMTQTITPASFTTTTLSSITPDKVQSSSNGFREVPVQRDQSNSVRSQVGNSDNKPASGQVKSKSQKNHSTKLANNLQSTNTQSQTRKTKTSSSSTKKQTTSNLNRPTMSTGSSVASSLISTSTKQPGTKNQASKKSGNGQKSSAEQKRFSSTARLPQDSTLSSSFQPESSQMSIFPTSRQSSSSASGTISGPSLSLQATEQADLSSTSSSGTLEPQAESNSRTVGQSSSMNNIQNSPAPSSTLATVSSSTARSAPKATFASSSAGAGAGAGASGRTSTQLGRQRLTDSGEYSMGDSPLGETSDGAGLDALDELRASIPGEPIVDYPILSAPPKSSFDCRAQSCPGGYYADMEAKCQVFHICQTDGRSQSFLCPNGTIFSQQHFVCVFWWQVDCQDSRQFYKLNDNIYCNSQMASTPPPAGLVSQAATRGFSGQADGTSMGFIDSSTPGQAMTNPQGFNQAALSPVISTNSASGQQQQQLPADTRYSVEGDMADSVRQEGSSTFGPPPATDLTSSSQSSSLDGQQATGVSGESQNGAATSTGATASESTAGQQRVEISRRAAAAAA